MGIWVGIDWGTEAHEVCGVGEDGKVSFRWRIEHEAEALQAFATQLLEKAAGAEIRVAIESKRGALIDTLRAHGIRVFHLNPKQLDRFRDRHTISGSKNDAIDAMVLAQSLRTDEPLHHEIASCDAESNELRELVRAYETLVKSGVALSHQTRDLLARYFPQLLSLGSTTDAWVLELWQLCSRPQDAHELSEATLAEFLRKHRVGRWKGKPAEALCRLRATEFTLAPGVEAGCIAHLRHLVPLLLLTQTHRRACERQIEKHLKQRMAAEAAGEKKHRHATILLSLPGLGTIGCATMLTEAAELLEERNYHRLRLRCGVAPSSRHTGKQRHPTVMMRKACNAHLRRAVYHWARASLPRSPRNRAYYANLRARGHSHGRALRSLADRELKMLVTMLRDNALYDPEKRALAA